MNRLSTANDNEIDVKKELIQKLSFIRKKYEDEYRMFSRLVHIIILQIISAVLYGAFYVVITWALVETLKESLFYNSAILKLLILSFTIFVILLVTSLMMVSIAKVFRNKIAELKQEADAETDVYNFLIQNLTEDYAVFPNLSFGYGDIDITVVGPTGIFVIDVKSNRGFVAKSSHGNLTIIDGDDAHKNYRRQVIQEAMQLRSYLMSKINFSLFIYPAIVMPNASIMKNTVLESQNDNFKIPVVNKKELLEFIYSKEKINSGKIEKVVKAIEDYYKNLIY